MTRESYLVVIAAAVHDDIDPSVSKGVKDSN